MTTVFLLWHVHSLSEDTEDEKLIGVYATEREAQAAISRLQNLPGFKDSPEGFDIAVYEIGKDHWSEGFSQI